MEGSMSRQQTDQKSFPFTIGGSDRRFPSLGAALSYAQNLAIDNGTPVQMGVYDNGNQVMRVSRGESGVVITEGVET
jgi:hypothetical protein